MAKYVLTKYLELFEHNSYDFKYYFAPNGVIDWYGRTIRGATKIHDFLRHDVYPYFEHRKFSEPAFCDPIETNINHLRTKIFSNKVVDHVHPINRLPYKVPLKTYADSDVEDNHDCAASTDALLQKISQPATPDNSYIGDLTPPASGHKETTTNLKLDEEVEPHSNTHNQRSHDESYDNARYLPTHGKRASLHYGEGSLYDDSSSSSDDDDFNLEASYSPLQYIEVKGVVRTKNNLRTEEISRHSQVPGRISRRRHKTCIRLSFRRRLSDNDIQFALIIYEPLEPVTCHSASRILLQEFRFIASRSDDESVGDHTTISDIPTDVITNVEDDLNEYNEAATVALSKEQMRTPTKSKSTTPPTMKRKSRSSVPAITGHKRLNNSPCGPIPKRTAARSLRL